MVCTNSYTHTHKHTDAYICVWMKLHTECGVWHKNKKLTTTKASRKTSTLHVVKSGQKFAITTATPKHDRLTTTHTNANTCLNIFSLPLTTPSNPFIISTLHQLTHTLNTPFTKLFVNEREKKRVNLLHSSMVVDSGTKVWNVILFSLWEHLCVCLCVCKCLFITIQCGSIK